MLGINKRINVIPDLLLFHIVHLTMQWRIYGIGPYPPTNGKVSIYKREAGNKIHRATKLYVRIYNVSDLFKKYNNRDCK